MTTHASRRLGEHAEVLESKGLSPRALSDAIERVKAPIITIEVKGRQGLLVFVPVNFI
ncbi:hypothetical protein KN1_13470 [Stygiolobus caldivivus]|uniref:Uncharacterized protein n=1 Tax=Stygiolobus caldivivus TaxID=2824673 RepID=A0A8D5ZJ72_9CREN|nr:hypothetical protein KN1_13470 [Stygiolobus caldivivus]